MYICVCVCIYVYIYLYTFISAIYLVLSKSYLNLKMQKSKVTIHPGLPWMDFNLYLLSWVIIHSAHLKNILVN